MEWRKPTIIKIWEKYNRLTIMKEVFWRRARYVQCQCDCWNIIERNLSNVINKKSISCWCYQKEIASKTFTKHWMFWTRIYVIYTAMKSRCNDEKHKNYGWRWIKCLWNTFEEFYEDMKDWYSDELSIDRINNDWNYCKENCRWATRKEQSNNRRDNIQITIKWVTKLMIEWCEIYWIKKNTVYSRLHKGRNKQKAILTPKLK